MNAMTPPADKVNILLVDDQPAKLLSYEVMLGELGENLHQGEFGQRGIAASAEERDRRRADRCRACPISTGSSWRR